MEPGSSPSSTPTTSTSAEHATKTVPVALSEPDTSSLSLSVNTVTQPSEITEEEIILEFSQPLASTAASASELKTDGSVTATTGSISNAERPESTTPESVAAVASVGSKKAALESTSSVLVSKSVTLASNIAESTSTASASTSTISASTSTISTSTAITATNTAASSTNASASSTTASAPAALSPQGTSPANPVTDWTGLIHKLYPDILTKTYFVPPIHFNRVPYGRVVVKGSTRSSNTVVHVQQLPGQPKHTPAHHGASATQGPLFPDEAYEKKPRNAQISDFRDDKAQRQVLANLEELDKQGKGPMVILSQFNFRNYLNKPVWAAASDQFIKPQDLNTDNKKKYEDREADFLLFHRKHGVLIGEIKSVGGYKQDISEEKASVKKKMEDALEQLEKCRYIIASITSDIAPGLTIRASVFLPNIERTIVKEVLSADSSLAQDLQRVLGAANLAEAIDFCCCKEQLLPHELELEPSFLSRLLPWKKPKHSKQRAALEKWWARRMEGVRDETLTDDIHEQIIARFIGPASTVSVYCNIVPRVGAPEVRTHGEAVAELGKRLSRLVLTPHQLGIINNYRPRLWLNGPPGTGKTVLLVLQGVRWVLENHTVNLVSIFVSSLAAVFLIKSQVEKTVAASEGNKPQLQPPQQRVISHDFDLVNAEDKEGELKKAVQELKRHVDTEGRLYVLMDEVEFNTTSTGKQVTSLVHCLLKEVKELHLWCAGVDNRMMDKKLKKEIESEKNLNPLRSAPRVINEVQAGFPSYFLDDYEDNGIPAPGDGAPAIRLRHEGEGHEKETWPIECHQCGRLVAEEMKRLRQEHPGGNNPKLPWKDFVVITRNNNFGDDVIDNEGQVTSEACAFVRGLREQGVPVNVLGQKDLNNNRQAWRERVERAALAEEDEVVVAYYVYLNGLERKVLVWLPGRLKSEDRNDEDGFIEAGDRLQGLSRCTTQLVVVEVPKIDKKKKKKFESQLGSEFQV